MFTRGSKGPADAGVLGGCSGGAQARPQTGSELTVREDPGPWRPAAGPPQAEGQPGPDGATVMTWDRRTPVWPQTSRTEAGPRDAELGSEGQRFVFGVMGGAGEL